MSDNVMKFTATAKTVRAEPDSNVTLENLPAENPGIRIEQGSQGFVRWGAGASAFSFDVDARRAAGRAFKLPKNATHFSVAGGPLIYTIGTAEWAQ